MATLLTIIPTSSPQLALLLYAGVILWLLPCAIQDHRTRQISNWLTVPLFLLAWPAALYLNTFGLTLATFLGFWCAFKVSGGMGPADAKIAVGVAAVAPLGLLAGLALSALAFLGGRWRGGRPVHVPGALAFYLGAVVSFFGLVGAAVLGSRPG